jgi:repressor LexA
MTDEICYNPTTIKRLHLDKGAEKMYPKNEERKLEIYKFITSFLEEYGVTPTTADIQEEFGISKAVVRKYLIRLEEDGYIEKFGRNQIVTRLTRDGVTLIPVAGTIACGQPSLAIQDIENYIPISKALLGEGDYFALVANGDSMTEAGIDKGDLVIIRQQATANNGEIVAAMLPDEYSSDCKATLKRFYKEEKQFRLHPENIYMDDIYVDEVTILGVAVKVIKDLR